MPNAASGMIVVLSNVGKPVLLISAKRQCLLSALTWRCLCCQSAVLVLQAFCSDLINNTSTRPLDKIDPIEFITWVFDGVKVESEMQS